MIISGLFVSFQCDSTKHGYNYQGLGLQNCVELFLTRCSPRRLCPYGTFRRSSLRWDFDVRCRDGVLECILSTYRCAETANYGIIEFQSKLHKCPQSYLSCHRKRLIGWLYAMWSEFSREVRSLSPAIIQLLPPMGCQIHASPSMANKRRKKKSA